MDPTENLNEINYQKTEADSKQQLAHSVRRNLKSATLKSGMENQKNLTTQNRLDILLEENNQNVYINLPNDQISIDPQILNEMKSNLQVQISEEPLVEDLYSPTILFVNTKQRIKYKIEQIQRICEQAIRQIKHQYIKKEEDLISEFKDLEDQQEIKNNRPLLLQEDSEIQSMIGKSLKMVDVDSPEDRINQVIYLVKQNNQFSDFQIESEARKLLLSEIQNRETSIRQEMQEEFNQQKQILIQQFSIQLQQEKEKIEAACEENLSKRVEEVKITLQQKYPEGSKQKDELEKKISAQILQKYQSKFNE